MTKAPKKTWLQDAGDYEKAFEAARDTETGITWCQDPQDEHDTCYIREDVSRAMVAAHGERCAVSALSQAGRWESAVDGTDAGETICHEIRALTPDDAKAALDRLIAEAEARGVQKEREACAGVALNARLGLTGQLDTVKDVRALIAAAIRNRSKGDD